MDTIGIDFGMENLKVVRSRGNRNVERVNIGSTQNDDPVPNVILYKKN